MPGTFNDMMGSRMWAIIFGIFLAIPCQVWADESEAPKPTAAAGASSDVDAGKAVYEKRCIYCHGETGAGDGPASERLNPKPRDFTMGLYKYRTTTSGQLPTDEDLFRVVSKGLPGTGMPPWGDPREFQITEQERHHVIQYIKTFSRKFARQKDPLEVVEIGKEIPASPESIEKGRALFKEMECFKCHGNEGRGDGPSAPELTDDKGDPIRPRNLTRNWHFRGGGEAKDIYMRVNTGLNGTPMPSFKDSLDNEKSWHLANYVRSLSPEKRPELDVVIKAKKVEGEIPVDPSDPAWREGVASWFPLVGQVIREPRHFTPAVGDIFVKALYNAKEMGFMLEWDDPSLSRFNEEAGTFEDQVAIQFPVELYPGAKKPYFLMGDDKKPVNLWTWKAESNLFVESNANGIDKEREQGKESQAISGKGVYQEGRYRVVMKRSLTTPDTQNDIQFQSGKFVPVAFYAWEGTNGETKSKRAISHWYFSLIEPETPKTVYIYPPLVVLVVLGLELLLQKKLRRENGKGSGDDSKKV